MKHALVAGGAGFLGSHLCDVLLSSGHTVTCLDNLLTGAFTNVENNLSKYPKTFKFIVEDITNDRSMCDMPGKFDVIFNLACPASPPIYQRDPIQTMLTSVVGTRNLLSIAKCHGAIFFQASTSEVYGDPREHPQTESYRGNVNPIGPRACYDEGKRAAEALCFDFNRKYGIDVRVARIFNTYGPRMQEDDGRVVSNFIVQALRGEPLTIYGSGMQTRSFCYVDDLIDGFIKFVDMCVPRVVGPMNLGNPDEHTVIDLANKIIAATNSRSIIVFEPLPDDDPTLRCPDIGFAKKCLGWVPKVSLEDGLNRTISYFGVRNRRV